MTATRELVDDISLALYFAHICVFRDILEKRPHIGGIRLGGDETTIFFGRVAEGSQGVM